MAAWPVVSFFQDPSLLWMAVPAALLVGLSKSGIVSGIGMLSTPLMAMAMPVPQAAAMVLPWLVVADAMGLMALSRHANWSLLRVLLPAGVLGIGVGWAVFGWLSPPAVALITGALTLVFVLQRLLWPPRADAPVPARVWGRVAGVMSGFTSFVAHAGSPPVGFYVLPHKLPPLVYSGTLAVFFATINMSKWVPYGLLGLLDWRQLAASLLLVPCVGLGVWVGVRLLGRVDAALFARLFVLGMSVAGLKLVWDGWRGLGLSLG